MINTFWFSRLRFIVLVLLPLLFAWQLSAQSPEGLRVEPPFWWAGMKNTGLQLLVYGKDVGKSSVLVKYPGIEVVRTIQTENPNYLFVNLQLETSVAPGNVELVFAVGKKQLFSYNYELKARRAGSAGRKGFNNSDVIYLLMPDRFANGDVSNDRVEGMIEGPDRTNPSGRHGGDIAGIQNHLSYFNDLGVTSLWINPLLENNNQAYTYHGYAITDFYKIDPRFGSNDDYVALVSAAHEKKLKIVMDMVFNHCGINHWFIRDLPAKNWIHQFPEFTRSNFRAETITDPYASEADKEKMLTGWFDTNMPDLDQRNELLRNYLIQNSIWWIEFADLDGIRLDTQPYPYPEMTSEWTARVFEEYPDFNIVGEAWLQKESMTASYQKDAIVGNGYNSGMPVVTDFPLNGAMGRAFTENEGWSEGMARLYMVLAQDFLYANPDNTLTFLDNHDLNRYFNTIGNDLPTLKMALVFLLTTRGIPQIYYGTELLMDGQEHKGHGDIRRDFPGGWPGDSLNAFTPEGRTAKQNEAFDYLQTLLKWRQGSEAIANGKLLHFIPEDGVYVYFRVTEKKKVMVVINRNESDKMLKMSRFDEALDGFTAGFDVILKESVPIAPEMIFTARTATVYDLTK